MILNSSSKYHTILAEYFLSKKYTDDLTNWDNCSIRILSELPYQRMHSDTPGKVENLLCNLLFIEASIQIGLLNNLIEDINLALNKFGLNSIKPIRDSLYHGLAAIRNRPQYSIYTLVNRLIHAEKYDIIQSFLTSTLSILNKKGIWLKTRTKFPSNQYIKGIRAINPIKKTIHLISNNKYIEEHDLETGILIKFQPLNTKDSLLDIFIHPVTDSIAAIYGNGKLLIDNRHTSHILKPWKSCYGWFNDGIIGINESNQLIFINLQKNAASVLWEFPIPPFSKFSVSKNMKTAIIISGDRLPNQKILIIQTNNNRAVCSDWGPVNVLIKLACLDEEGSDMLFTTQSRELWLINIKSKESKKVSYRSADGSSFRSVVDKCTLAKIKDNHIALCATYDGELFVWDSSEDYVKRKGLYKGIRQGTSVRVMEFLPEENKFVYATEEFLETLSISGQERLSSFDPVTQCCVTNEGWMITVHEFSKRVVWFKQGQHVSDFVVNNYQPCIITTFRTEGTVVVGYTNGLVVKLKPNLKPEIDDAIDLFDCRVISLINIDSERILAASEKGEIKIIKFTSNPVERFIKPVGIIRTENFVRRLGKREEFVSCGRYHSGQSLSSIDLVKTDNSTEVILETKELVTNVATNNDGDMVYVVFNDNLKCYLRQRNNWNLVHKREAEITHMTSCTNDLLAIVLSDNGIFWLEIWDVYKQLKTIASQELPFQPSCICYSDEHIGIGASDGKHFILDIQNIYSIMEN